MPPSPLIPQFVQRPTAGGSWKGLILRRSGFLLDPDACDIALNVDIARASNSLVSRKGGKVTTASTTGGLGLIRYSQHNNVTGLDTTIRLVVGSQLQIVSYGTVSITYGGAGTSVVVSHLYDSTASGWVFTLVVDGVTVLSYTTGIGFDETTPKTLANLKTAVDATAGFAMTITTIPTTEPAATAMPSISSQAFAGGAASWTCEYLTTANQPASAANPFVNFAATKNQSDFENASYYNINSVCYINTGYDEQIKYDGQKVFRSGMPQPTSTFVVTSIGAGGGVDTGAHTYTMYYRQQDKQGNITEGMESVQQIGTTTAGNNTVNLTIPNIQNTTGFNTDQTKVNGNQVGVTTIVVTGSTLKVGDPLFFINRATGAAVTDRTVQAGSTATSLIINGTAVNVNNNDVITAGLSIVVTRTKLGGTQPYLITQFSNDSSAATSAYADVAADSSLSILFNRPAVGFEHGLPPKGRYSTVYQSIPVIAGGLSSGNLLSWADASGAEHWPPLNNTNVITTLNDSISGLLPTNNYLLIGKTRSAHQMSGSLQSLDFRIDEITRRFGCSSNSSMTQLPDGSVAFMSEKGPVRIAGGDTPDDIALTILPIFSQIPLTPDTTLALRRSVAATDLKKEKLIFFIPCETTSSGNVAANSNSLIVVADLANFYYAQDELAQERVVRQYFPWFMWNGLNMAGGVIIEDNNFYWMERRYSSFNSAMSYNLWSRMNTDSVYDFIDHNVAIDWRYQQGWETLGDPSVYKVPNRIKITASDPLLPPNCTISVQKFLDYTSQQDTTLSVTQGSSTSGRGWGLDGWGTAPYGSPSNPSMLGNLTRSRCQSWRYYFSHNKIYECPVITAWETEVSTAYIPAMKN